MIIHLIEKKKRKKNTKAQVKEKKMWAQLLKSIQEGADRSATVEDFYVINEDLSKIKWKWISNLSGWGESTSPTCLPYFLYK